MISRSNLTPDLSIFSKMFQNTEWAQNLSRDKNDQRASPVIWKRNLIPWQILSHFGILENFWKNRKVRDQIRPTISYRLIKSEFPKNSRIPYYQVPELNIEHKISLKPHNRRQKVIKKSLKLLVRFRKKLKIRAKL